MVNVMLTAIQNLYENYDNTLMRASRFVTRRHDYEPGDDPFFIEHQDMMAFYYAKDLANASMVPFQDMSLSTMELSNSPYFSKLTQNSFLARLATAQAEVNSRITHSYKKPVFGIEQVTTQSGLTYAIHQKVIAEKNFCNLLHFERFLASPLEKGQSEPRFPKILVVTPYSGHFATLLRDTVRALLQDHDVYVTDWANAREVPLHHGEFTLENYIEYLKEFVDFIDDDIHVLGVCQPAVPVLALVAYLEQEKIEHKIKSMILMGGPIDTRINPTEVNKLAKAKGLDWFDRKVISYAPHYYPGAFRRVVPGFVMLAGFMSLNLDVHFSAPVKLFEKLVTGDKDGAESHRKFYDEYRSVLDLPADYYLDSIRYAFLVHSLPLGKFSYHGVDLDPAAITKVGLMTVEGEKDDISGVGQTYAAHTICKNIPEEKRMHHLQEGVGHYGVFNGHRWRSEIMPQIRDFISRIA